LLRKTSATLSLLLLLTLAAAPLHRLHAQTPRTPPQSATITRDDADSIDDNDDIFFPGPSAEIDGDNGLPADPDGIGGTDPVPPGRHPRQPNRPGHHGCDDTPQDNPITQ
jgi:hypothetical protein